tara:strand:+ start:7436 stop:7885 length:450 start_codon:yes stop_codon:yes gene_type:complete
LKEKLYKLISTFFGLGYISPFPGTLTSFLTVVIIWLTQEYFGFQISLVCIIFVTLIAYISIENDVNKKSDPKEIVIDEFIGQSIVLIFLPLTFKYYILGFIFFRIFDIYKPMPINYFEKKYQNAFGIIFDDIIAAGYALMAIYIINIII